jgi:hypothetical protein
LSLAVYFKGFLHSKTATTYQMSYYNTNKETGDTLNSSRAKARTQEDKILTIFKVYRQLSASQSFAKFTSLHDSERATPITSIRRAITNLCKAGKLEKTADMIKGLYGKNEHIYKIKSIEAEQKTLF